MKRKIPLKQTTETSGIRFRWILKHQQWRVEGSFGAKSQARIADMQKEERLVCARVDRDFKKFHMFLSATRAENKSAEVFFLFFGTAKRLGKNR